MTHLQLNVFNRSVEQKFVDFPLSLEARVHDCYSTHCRLSRCYYILYLSLKIAISYGLFRTIIGPASSLPAKSRRSGLQELDILDSMASDWGIRLRASMRYGQELEVCTHCFLKVYFPSSEVDSAQVESIEAIADTKRIAS